MFIFASKHLGRGILGALMLFSLVACSHGLHSGAFRGLAGDDSIPSLPRRIFRDSKLNAGVGVGVSEDAMTAYLIRSARSQGRMVPFAMQKFVRAQEAVDAARNLPVNQEERLSLIAAREKEYHRIVKLRERAEGKPLIGAMEPDLLRAERELKEANNLRLYTESERFSEIAKAEAILIGHAGLDLATRNLDNARKWPTSSAEKSALEEARRKALVEVDVRLRAANQGVVAAEAAIAKITSIKDSAERAAALAASQTTAAEMKSLATTAAMEYRLAQDALRQAREMKVITQSERAGMLKMAEKAYEDALKSHLLAISPKNTKVQVVLKSLKYIGEGLLIAEAGNRYYVWDAVSASPDFVAADSILGVSTKGLSVGQIAGLLKNKGSKLPSAPMRMEESDYLDEVLGKDRDAKAADN